MMQDPVIVTDGFTYDRLFIEKWMEINMNSPLTKEKLKKDVILPNQALRIQIKEYLEKNPHLNDSLSDER